MGSEATQFSIRIVPVSATGNPLGSAVYLEITSSINYVSKTIADWRLHLGDIPLVSLGLPSADNKCQVSGGPDGDFTVLCDKETALSTLMFYCTDPKITVREIRYQDAVYTDVADITAVDMAVEDLPNDHTFSDVESDAEEENWGSSTLGANPVRCSAKRDGSDVTVYFFASCSTAKDYSPFSGVVETGENLKYIGRFFLQRRRKGPCNRRKI